MSLFPGWRIARPIGPRPFCLIVITLALLLFALPYPPKDQIKQLSKIVMSHATIVVLGASTIDYVSECDTDHRAIPKLLADLTGQQVLDLSTGGQHFADSVNLAAEVATKASVTDVVLPVSYSLIDGWTTPPYRKLLVDKIAAPGFSVSHASGLSDFWSGLSDQPMRVERGYSFDGHAYPDYRVIADTEFRRERQLASCPEQVTHDPQFTRSYFWWTHVKATANPEFYDLVAEVKGRLAARGKRLHVVMMPANLQLMATMDPSWAEAVQRGQDHVVAALSRRGLDVLDLSKDFGADEFSTQWCACIHMNQKGRLHLVDAIGRDFHSTLAAAPVAEGSRQSLVSGVER